MRPSLTRGIVYGLLFSLPVWAALLWAMRAYAATPAVEAQPVKVSIKGWTMTKGCPTPVRKAPMTVVIVFSDSSFVVVTDETDKETLDAVRAGLGDMMGRVFQFPCGTSS